MRMFAGDRTVKLLDKMGLKDGERIESPMVTKSIETAQKRVEENNFGIRKRLLEYDDVMNAQRNVIYTKRHHALMGERLGIDILNMFYDRIESIVELYGSKGDYADLSLDIMRTFAIEMPLTEDEYRQKDGDDLIDVLYQAVVAAFKARTDKMAESAYRVIKQIVEEQDAKGLIRVPINDGRRLYGITVDITEAYDSQCKSIVKAWQKASVLMSIDEMWKEHLRDLDQLRQSVQNASYEQKDPLLIYKLESFNLFKDMVNKMNDKAISMLMRGQINVREEQPEAQVRRAEPERRQDYSKYKTNKEDYPGQNAQRQAMRSSHTPQGPVSPVVAAPRVGRNDPCPCGSGKKFKNCCGKGL